MERGILYNCHNRTAYDRRESAAIFQRFSITYRGRTSDHVLSFAMNIYSGDVCADVLQSYRNLLRNGDETLSIKYIKDLDIQWATKGSDVDFSKLPTDGFSTTVIPDDSDGKYFPGRNCVAVLEEIK